MSEITYDDRMSTSDAVLWNVERDPMLRSTILSVWVMSGEPDEVRFLNTLHGATHKIPRLRQRAVADPYGIAPPKWVDDPFFDPSYHIRRTRCPGEGTVRDLLDYAAPVGMTAFDRDRPLWELHIVEGMAEGKVGAVLKLHHSVGDGMGLVKMTESMVETNDHHERKTYEPWRTDRPLPTRRELVTEAIRHRAGEARANTSGLLRALGSTATEVLTAPTATVRRLGAVAGSVGRMMAPAAESSSTALANKGMTNHLDVVAVPLDDLRAAGKATGGTLNDAFVAAVASGLAGYLHAIGDLDVESVSMNMPINIRDEHNAGHASNHFVPARFDVPLDVDDPADRMRVIHELVDGMRNEPAMPLADVINTVISRLGVDLSVSLAGGMMKSLDIVTSNVPGPPFRVYSSGAAIEQMFPFGPLGGAAVNFTLFSYDGTCYIGINSDRRAVTDPTLLTQFVEKGFAEVAAVG